MSDSGDPNKKFRTLKGFPKGEEPDAESYFHFSATLRIHGENVPFDEISNRLGVHPTHVHRKGDRRSKSYEGYSDDAWHFAPSLSKTEPLEKHIEALWQVVKPEAAYIRALKQKFKVDVFCGYRSNSDTAGFEVSHKCLELFTTLEVSFGVSVIIT